ncbi:hypothetical protein F5883DRAFT_421407 [Diaporthe sp. PMI_573]|nr:hypothetical protein F5883DRAFT_421407 [Diaporthaceae sp. PMI_573]
MDQVTGTDQDGYKNIPNSLIQTALTAEEINAISSRISEEELPAVRSEIRRRAESIYNNWETLEFIVKRHEATIQKRWTSKSNMKRRGLLLTTWPNMARDHRPDIALKTFRRPRQLSLYEGRQREALLMPYINLHDLTKTEPLLLMINARARWPPQTFSKRDLQLSTQSFDLTKWRLLEGYSMDMDGRKPVPETYGKLQERPTKDYSAVLGVDPRLADGTISPGDGLWILEIQDRIYKFLLDTVQHILHDIPLGDLTGPKYNIQPEPPLPSANSREDGVISLAGTNLEAMYSSPGQMDLRRLQLLVTAKANEEEDKLWALREDPSRFSEGLKDYIAHRPEYVPDLSGSKHPSTTVDGYRARWDSDAKTTIDDVLPIMFLLSNFICVEFWDGLMRDITGLVELKKQHFDGKNIKSGDALPEPFTLALYKLQATLCACVEERLAVLRRATFSSPPLRPYMQRASPETIDTFVCKSSKRLPRHIADFMDILNGLFSEDMITIKGHTAGVQSLMEEYEVFINTVPAAHQAISSYVAQEISTLALLSECLRQICLFQPWATAFPKDIRAPHVQEVLRAHLKDQRRKTIPLETFKPSIRICSMASAIAKSPYPVHKKRTAANVDAMQSAETSLDEMWDVFLAEIEQHDALPRHSKNVLYFQQRQLQRTLEWVEPVRATTKTKTPAMVETFEVLGQSFRELDIDTTRKLQSSPPEKPKVKTRGTAAPQATATSEKAQKTEQEDQGPVHVIQVDRRALKVFGALFHTPCAESLPGEVPWNEFLHAMRSAGFWMEKLYGSVWQFTPRRDDDSDASMSSILFHEPHPHTKIPFLHARRHGRRLGRAYGWSGQTFVLK